MTETEKLNRFHIKAEPYIQYMKSVGVFQTSEVYNTVMDLNCWYYKGNREIDSYIVDLINKKVDKKRNKYLFRFVPKVYKFEIRFARDGRPFVTDKQTVNRKYYAYTRCKNLEEFKVVLNKQLQIFKEGLNLYRKYEAEQDFEK